jgi:hypothetical protein
MRLAISRWVFGLPVLGVLSLGCDSGPPAAEPSQKPAVAPAPVAQGTKGGKPARRPVGESKNVRLTPGDD